MDVTYLDFGAFLSFPFPSFPPSVSLIWLYRFTPTLPPRRVIPLLPSLLIHHSFSLSVSLCLFSPLSRFSFPLVYNYLSIFFLYRRDWPL